MNIAEILKNCPKGTKLYSPADGELELTGVDTLIHCVDKDKYPRIYQLDGKKNKHGVLMLYPSQEQRDWSEFLIPFKDGDVIISTDKYPRNVKFENMAIFKGYRPVGDNKMSIYCQFNGSGDFLDYPMNVYHDNWRIATDKERQEFFEKLRELRYDFINGELIRSFKYGDIVASYNETYQCTNIGIFDEYIDIKHHKLLCVTHPEGISIVDENYDISEGWFNKGTRLATTEEQLYLLAELANIGYAWEDGKLSKIIKPKFKVGDIITSGNGIEIEITAIEDGLYQGIHYKGGINFAFPISKQDFYHLAKFDITSLQPYDRVLVRDPDGDTWYPTLVSFVTSGFVYVINRDEPVYEVIPFEGHEHLIGLSEDPNDYYITWE